MWSMLITAAVTAVATLAGVSITQWRASVTEGKKHAWSIAEEEKRYEREARQEHIRWQREQCMRLRDERKAIYARFLTAGRMIWNVNKASPPNDGDFYDVSFTAQMIATDAVRNIIISLSNLVGGYEKKKTACERGLRFVGCEYSSCLR